MLGSQFGPHPNRAQRGREILLRVTPAGQEQKRDWNQSVWPPSLGCIPGCTMGSNRGQVDQVPSLSNSPPTCREGQESYMREWVC